MRNPLSKKGDKESLDIFFIIPLLVLLFVILFTIMGYSVMGSHLSQYRKQIISRTPFVSFPETPAQNVRSFFQKRGLSEATLAKKENLLTSATLSALSQEDSSMWPVHVDAEGNYSIDYLTTQDTFAVTVSGKPYAVHKADAEAWFLAQGFSQGELCSLPVRFFAPYLAEDDLTDVSVFFPTGCPAE